MVVDVKLKMAPDTISTFSISALPLDVSFQMSVHFLHPWTLCQKSSPQIFYKWCIRYGIKYKRGVIFGPHAQLVSLNVVIYQCLQIFFIMFIYMYVKTSCHNPTQSYSTCNGLYYGTWNYLVFFHQGDRHLICWYSAQSRAFLEESGDGKIKKNLLLSFYFVSWGGAIKKIKWWYCF